LAKNAIHFNQISYINPFFSAFENSGVNLEALKLKSRLKQFDIQNVDSYVPVKPLEEFLNLVYTSQGISHLDRSFVQQFELQDMGDFGAYLASLPNALAAIDESIKLEPLIISNCRTKLLIHGKETFYHWKFHNERTHGRLISEEFCFHMVLTGLQLVLGPSFGVTSLYIPRYIYSKLKHTLPEQHFDLHLTEDTYSVGFDTANLTAKIELCQESERRPDMPSDSTRVRVSNLLTGFNDGIVPSVESLSEMLEISSRSLHRHLASEGTSFKELLKEYLLTSAIDQLENTERPVNEISEALGYKESTNFIRAFKSWTGTTPLQYRFNI
jgi:AraC-like DNA-binding protein